MKNLIITTILLSSAIAAGCVPQSVQRPSETMALPKYFPQPPAVRPVPAPTPRRDAFREANKGKTYSLSLKETELKDVLALLSRDSAMPIVAEQDVVGKVSVTIENKHLGDILYTVLKPLGYTATVENGIIVVGRPRLVTKTFKINYIKDKRSSTSSMNASVSSTGSSPVSSSYSGGSSTGSSSSSNDGTSSGSSSGSGSVNVTTTGTSDFWDEISKGLEAIIFGTSGSGKGGDSSGKSDKAGRKLVINRMAGVVYVTDFSDNMENISSFISDVETALKRQVLIQAHIIEVSLTDKFSLGLDWKSILDKSTNFAISQGLAPVPATNVFSISAQGDNFGFLLDAMKEQGHVNMLSSPKISTMNNQRAIIKLTTREVTWVNSTILNSQGNTLQTFTTPQVDEVGLFLDVTPNIDENGVITMQVHPSISELTKVSVSPDGKSSKPVIDVREVDTMIDIRSGQTVVIAGLIVDKLRETRRSVPLLGDIPYLGLAFSNIAQEKIKTELVILLTPYVLNEKNIEEIRKEHEQRVLHLDEGFQLINTMGAKESRGAAAPVRVEPVSLKEAGEISASLPVEEGTPAAVPPPATLPATPQKVVEPAPVPRAEPVSVPAVVSQLHPVAQVQAAPAVPPAAITAADPVPAVNSSADTTEAEQSLFRKGVVAYREVGNCREVVTIFDQFLDTYPTSFLAPVAASYRDECRIRLSAR